MIGIFAEFGSFWYSEYIYIIYYLEKYFNWRKQNDIIVCEFNIHFESSLSLSFLFSNKNGKNIVAISEN